MTSGQPLRVKTGVMRCKKRKWTGGCEIRYLPFVYQVRILISYSLFNWLYNPNIWECCLLNELPVSVMHLPVVNIVSRALLCRSVRGCFFRSYNCLDSGSRQRSGSFKRGGYLDWLKGECIQELQACPFSRSLIIRAASIPEAQSLPYGLWNWGLLLMYMSLCVQEMDTCTSPCCTGSIY